jgi:hypothetical protein
VIFVIRKNGGSRGLRPHPLLVRPRESTLFPLGDDSLAVFVAVLVVGAALRHGGHTSGRVGGPFDEAELFDCDAALLAVVIVQAILLSPSRGGEATPQPSCSWCSSSGGCGWTRNWHGAPVSV